LVADAEAEGVGEDIAEGFDDGFGDCDGSIGAAGPSWLDANIPSGFIEFTPSAIAIAAMVPPPSTVKPVERTELEVVLVPMSCLRFRRRSRLASFRACCDTKNLSTECNLRHQIFTAESWPAQPREILFFTNRTFQK
jgi:hypothetical protein